MNFTPPYIYSGLYEQEEFARAISCVKAVCEQVIERETPKLEGYYSESQVEELLLLANRPRHFDAQWATEHLTARTTPLLANTFQAATGQAIAREHYWAHLKTNQRRSLLRGTGTGCLG